MGHVMLHDCNSALCFTTGKHLLAGVQLYTLALRQVPSSFTA